MRSLIKALKLLTALPIVASLVSVNLASAAGSPAFNNLPEDSEFLTGRNVTAGQTLVSDPVHANANDEVEVVVYYHNAVEGTTAKNVKIKIDLPTSVVAKQHIVTGTLSADNAPTVHGTISKGLEIGQPDLTINSDSDTKLAYIPGSVKWYPDASQQPGNQQANLPGGQTGDTIVTTGINLGDIEGCFQHAGFVTLRVKLSAPNVPVKPTLTVVKDVRAAGTGTYADSNRVKPGDLVEYRVTVTNNDTTAAAVNVKLSDVLPAGVHYVGPTQIEGGTKLSDGITTTNGVIITPSLSSGKSITVTFKASTDTIFVNDQCAINTVTASADNSANKPTDTAKTCFDVIKPSLEIIKDVRKAGTADEFRNDNRVNPGTQVEYQLSVRNMDGKTDLHNVKVQDFLPAHTTYVGPTFMTRGTVKTQLPDGIVGTNGITIDVLHANETVKITFVVSTESTLAQDACLINKAKVTAPDAANGPEDTASTCIDTVPVVKPTPTPATPTPGPLPTLPRTGPEASVLLLTGLTGMGGSAARYYNLKRNLKKRIETLDIR